MDKVENFSNKRWNNPKIVVFYEVDNVIRKNIEDVNN